MADDRKVIEDIIRQWSRMTIFLAGHHETVVSHYLANNLGECPPQEVLESNIRHLAKLVADHLVLAGSSWDEGALPLNVQERIKLFKEVLDMAIQSIAHMPDPYDVMGPCQVCSFGHDKTAAN